MRIQEEEVNGLRAVGKPRPLGQDMRTGGGRARPPQKTEERHTVRCAVLLKQMRKNMGSEYERVLEKSSYRSDNIRPRSISFYVSIIHLSG